jgi:hypothetical protein
MSRLRVTVETESGSKTFPVTPKVEVEFERHWSVGLGKVFAEMRREHLHHLAWLAVKASGETVKPFDSWLETINDTSLEVNEDGPFTKTP